MQRRRILQKSGGGASSNGVGIICPLVGIGLTDLPKSVGGGGGGQCPLLLPSGVPVQWKLLRHQRHTMRQKPLHYFERLNLGKKSVLFNIGGI